MEEYRDHSLAGQSDQPANKMPMRALLIGLPMLALVLAAAYFVYSQIGFRKMVSYYAAMQQSTLEAELTVSQLDEIKRQLDFKDFDRARYDQVAAQRAQLEEELWQRDFQIYCRSPLTQESIRRSITGRWLWPAQRRSADKLLAGFTKAPLSATCQQLEDTQPLEAAYRALLNDNIIIQDFINRSKTTADIQNNLPMIAGLAKYTQNHKFDGEDKIARSWPKHIEDLRLRKERLAVQYQAYQAEARRDYATADALYVRRDQLAEERARLDLRGPTLVRQREQAKAYVEANRELLEAVKIYRDAKLAGGWLKLPQLSLNAEAWFVLLSALDLYSLENDVYPKAASIQELLPVLEQRNYIGDLKAYSSDITYRSDGGSFTLGFRDEQSGEHREVSR